MLTSTLTKLNDKALSEIYQRLFSTDDGQLVLEDLRQRCFAYTTTQGTDVQYNEGKRQVLMMIETRLRPVAEEE